MKIIFFGSDEFAAGHLEYLLNYPYYVEVCITQPDKAKGRGMKVTMSPVKQCAKKKDMTVLQPDDLKDPSLISQLKNYEPDLFIVIAYGKKLPPEILAIPPLGAINVHGSLLPQYRGAAPINWAIINGEKETGITIIKMNETMDGGEILSQLHINVDPDETALTLKTKMAEIGPGFLLETIEKIKKNKILSIHQDDKSATLAPKLTKELGRIDWGKSAVDIYNLVRGLLPWPGAYVQYKDKVLKILETSVLLGELTDKKSGEVVRIEKEGFAVATGHGVLLIKQVHLEASNPMDAHSFVIGHRLEEGFQFQ